MKKISLLIASIFILFQFVFPVGASNQVTAYLFYGEGCPHCEKEMQFLNEIRGKYPSLEVRSFEIYQNRENAMFLRKVGDTLGVEIGGVPFLVIGDQYFVGYDENRTSVEIEKKINECLNNDCPDPIKELQKNINRSGETKKPEGESRGKVIDLPIFGSINTANFSLPILTGLIGFLDGFNPCAMWALIFLISLLLGMENRKRMWILGTAFIVTSAFVYFVFMSAWLNFFLFLGFIIWIRIAIGFLAIFGGLFNLKKFVSEKELVCKISKGERRQKVFQKVRATVEEKSFWIALGGIIVLAFMVNLVELICSAGLPAIYIQVLTMNELPTWQYYLYILLYVFFFMLDDLFVFFMAMITFRMTGLSTKYSRYSQLIGGLLMFIIGLLLIFKPEWLMFG